jgi:hypothetical protein
MRSRKTTLARSARRCGQRLQRIGPHLRQRVMRQDRQQVKGPLAELRRIRGWRGTIPKESFEKMGTHASQSMQVSALI